MAIGIGYKGSPSVLNSGAGNLEIIPAKEKLGSKYSFYKFEFTAKTSPVTVKINGERIYLEYGNFNMDLNDSPIHSFIVVDGNVEFSWIGAYSFK